MKKYIFFLLVLATILTSCKKIKQDEIICFTFGTAHGECLGNCTNFYLIQDGKLYPDNMEYFRNNSKLKFKSKALSNEKYLIAKPLLDKFPNYFWEHPNKRFGCPDCADEGGFYITVKRNGKTYIWDVEAFTEKLPVEIRQYIADMGEVLQKM